MLQPCLPQSKNGFGDLLARGKSPKVSVFLGEVTRKMGISEQTFYRWKKKFGGLMPSEVRKLRQLEEENARLRRLGADLSLDKEMLQEVIRKKL